MMGRHGGLRPHRHRRARRLVAALSAVAAALLVPALVLAHPLGNFTINHYAGLRIEPDRVLLDVVIDQAEIPTFEARIDFDLDGDGEMAPEEIAAGRVAACVALAPDLHLTADGAALDLRLAAAGLTFPAGLGGLSTMRSVCGFEAVLPARLSTGAPTRIAFSDGSNTQRIGWREITVVGSGVIVTPVGGEIRAASVSERLTAYPDELIARPLAEAGVDLEVVAGGPTVAPVVVPDAQPVAAPATEPTAAPVPAHAAAVESPAAVAPAAAIPGGVASGDLPSIFRTADLTPLVLLLSVLTAAALGAGHALTPGHGKTLMAAYLVGTRGTPVHALGLGLSVSLSHTVGILLLAAIVVGAADVLPPDLVVRAAPVVAAVSIVAIGGWMLLGEWRRRRSVAAAARAHEAAHAHGHDHDHDHGRGHDHDPLEHRHGGVRHSHAPATGSTISWRSLFVLGLAGGLIPSTSALLILLGSIAAGRPGFGFVLVVAFGLGMAAVMAGIGLAMVFARGRLDRLPAGTGLARAREAVPLMAAVLVFGLGLYLTAQAIGSSPTL
jgi:ABC-type nickel/cobalt efflux system permease component RcnA